MSEFGTGNATENDEQLTALERFLNKSYEGVCGVLFIMSKDTASTAFFALIGMLVDFLQMLAFCFYTKIAWKWDSAVVGWLDSITNFTRLYWYVDGNASTTQLVFYFCLALVVIILVDAFWVGYQFSQNKVRFIFTLKFLRGISDVVIGPLYIPIVAVFTMQLPCASDTPDCWSGASASLHVGIAVISILIGVLYIALSVTLVGSYYSRDPMSASPLSRPISRVMMAQLFVKTVLTIAFILLKKSTSARWFLLVLLILSTTGLSYLYTMQLPYFHFQFNVVRACTFWVLSWASICVIIAEYSGDMLNQSAGLSILFLVGSPLVAVAAWLATHYRRMSIMKHHHTDMDSPTEIELKVRFMLESTTETRMNRAAGLVVLHASSSGSHRDTHKAAKKRVQISNSTSKSSTPVANKPALKRPVSSPLSPVQVDEQQLESGGSMSITNSRSSQRSLEMLEEESRALEEQELLEEVEEIFAFGVLRFGNSAWMHLLRAQHSYYYHENKTVALSHLARAESRSPHLDESFSIYFLRKSAHELSSSTDGNTDIVAYIQLQKSIADAKKYDLGAARATLAFWEVLQGNQPDLSRMNELSTQINKSMGQAYEAFRLLMRLNANSISVLRMYAGFLLDLANEPEQARLMLTRADELEDQQSKDHHESGLDMTTLDDRHAIVSISAELKSLGTIIQVNATALRLLGFSKTELVGRNITAIVPLPFSTHHQSYLKRYIDIGDSTVLNKSRSVFAQHKSGFLIPLQLFVREVSSETEHAFLGVLKENVNPYQTALIDPNYNVMNCTVGLCDFFGVSLEEMQAGQFHLTHWLPTFEQMLGQLSSPAGVEIPMTLQSGRDVTSRMWLSALQITGEPVSWFQLRIQTSTTSSRPVPPSLVHQPSFSLPQYATSVRASHENDEQRDADDEEDGDKDRITVANGEMDDVFLSSDDDEVPPTLSSLAAPIHPTSQRVNLGNTSSQKQAKSKSAHGSASGQAFASIVTASATSSPAVASASLASPAAVSIVVSDAAARPPGSPASHQWVTNPLLSDVGLAASQAAASAVASATPSGKAVSSNERVTSSSNIGSPVQKYGTLARINLPAAQASSAAAFLVPSRANSLTVPNKAVAFPGKLSASPNASPRLGNRAVSNANANSALPASVAVSPAVADSLNQQAPLTSEMLRANAEVSDHSSRSGSSKSKANSIHSKFRTFAKSRESQTLSTTLRSLQIALSLAILFVFVASLLRYFLIKTSIDKFTASLNALSNAGLRRIWPTTFAIFARKMDLAQMGFYHYSMIADARAKMLPLLNTFISVNNDLYYGSARAQVLANAELTALYQSAQLKLETYKGGVPSELLRSLWDSTQMMQTAVTNLIYGGDAVLSLTDSNMYFLLQNNFGDIMKGLNRSVFLYQQETESDLTSLTAVAATLAFLPVLILLLVIVFMVRPIVEAVEDNKLTVLRLFLDIPIPLVRVFHDRIARRVTTLENVEEDAAAKADAVADENLAAETNEEDEGKVIQQVLHQQRVEEAAAIASGDASGEHSASKRRNRERHAKADAFLREAGFVQRNLTMLKIFSFVVFSVIYFAPTYTYFFGDFRASLASKPAQVNWASYRSMQLRTVSARLLKLLTQNYTQTYYAAPPLSVFPLVSGATVRDLITFNYELVTALGVGSTYYGTLAPENADQTAINFADACGVSPLIPADCQTYGTRSMTTGLYAAVLDWSEQAMLCEQMIVDAQARVDVEVANIAATNGGNASVVFAAQKAAAFAIINATLNSAELTQLLNYDYNYISPATDVATLQYPAAVTAMFASVAMPKTLVLVLWLLFVSAFQLFFFTPLIYKLHDEHRRTTSMLLMISPEVMENIPSIRVFVAKLSAAGADK